MKLLSTYLAYGLIISALAIAALYLNESQRAIALFSGIAAAPTGLLDAFFVVDYWAPPHLFGSNFSIEGILFSFGNGTLLWIIATLPFRKRMVAPKNVNGLPRFLAFYGCIALFVVAVTWERALGLTTLPLMASILLALSLIGLLILVRTPHLLPLGLAGGVGFMVFFAFQLAVINWIDPGYSQVWKEATRAGVLFLGYPGEELAWAAIYGAVWVTIIAQGCGAFPHAQKSR